MCVIFLSHAVLQKVKGATGSELIINKSFWFSLPGFVKVYKSLMVSSSSSSSHHHCLFFFINITINKIIFPILMSLSLTPRRPGSCSHGRRSAARATSRSKCSQSHLPLLMSCIESITQSNCAFSSFWQQKGCRRNRFFGGFVTCVCRVCEGCSVWMVSLCRVVYHTLMVRGVHVRCLNT